MDTNTSDALQHHPRIGHFKLNKTMAISHQENEGDGKQKMKTQIMMTTMAIAILLLQYSSNLSPSHSQISARATKDKQCQQSTL